MNRLFDVPVKSDPALPPMRGTERQIPWAEQIRKGKLPGCETLVRQVQDLESAHRRNGKIEQAAAQLAELGKAIEGLERLKDNDSARWWIDHRDNSPMELLTDAEANPGGSW